MTKPPKHAARLSVDLTGGWRLCMAASHGGGKVAVNQGGGKSFGNITTYDNLWDRNKLVTPEERLTRKSECLQVDVSCIRKGSKKKKEVNSERTEWFAIRNKPKQKNTDIWRPEGSLVEESACQCRRCRFHPWVGKIPWRRKWQPTPVFLPGEFHAQRSLAGYSPWGHKKSDMTFQFWETTLCKTAKWNLSIKAGVESKVLLPHHTEIWEWIKGSQDKDIIKSEAPHSSFQLDKNSKETMCDSHPHLIDLREKQLQILKGGSL